MIKWQLRAINTITNSDSKVVGTGVESLEGLIVFLDTSKTREKEHYKDYAFYITQVYNSDYRNNMVEFLNKCKQLQYDRSI